MALQASASAGQYVCECEGWEAPKAEIERQEIDALEAEPSKLRNQSSEPAVHIGWACWADNDTERCLTPTLVNYDPTEYPNKCKVYDAPVKPDHVKGDIEMSDVNIPLLDLAALSHKLQSENAAKDKEIKELKAQLQVAIKVFREAVLTSKWQAITNKELNNSLEETLRLKVELQAIRAQEPVAWRRLEKFALYEDFVYYATKCWDNLQPLYATPVKPDHVLVPIEPTEKMIDAACSQISNDNKLHAWRKDRVRIYKAMINTSKGE